MYRYIDKYLDLIILSLIIIITGIIIIIKILKENKAKAMEKKDLKVNLIGVLSNTFIFIVILVVLFMKIKSDYTRDYLIPCEETDYLFLIKDYNMSCKVNYDKLVQDIIYKKDDFVFEIINGDKRIYDNEPFNYKYISRILENILYINEEAFDLIVSNLKDNYQFSEKESSMVISINNVVVDIKYNKGKMEIRLDELRSYDGITITHYNNNYYEFDSKIIKLLFNSDIEEFAVNKNDDVIRYTRY
jgi:hypothetical protein